MAESVQTDNARREFLGQCGSALQALLIAGTMGPLLAACESSSSVTPPTGNDIEIGVGALDADGKFVVSDEKGPDGMKILVVRKDAATYLAMSTRCTHQGCEVGAPANNQIVCPCHGSRYDMEGAVIQGPAPAPLPRYSATYDASRQILTVHL
jgi:cytochrome b6-f complex iron-sulfur subunit